MVSRGLRFATTRTRRIGVTVLVAAASFTGCGEESGSDPITEVTRQLAADAKAGDWKRACDAMSARARAEFAAVGAELGVKGCADAIARVAALDDSPEILGKVDGEDVKVSNVKITGDRATAKVLPSFDDTDPVAHYVRENGAWKLDR
jgi:hypothetical protein